MKTPKVTCIDNRKVSLEEAQALVGGYVERVKIPESDDIMLVNEEGLLMMLLPNVQATWLAGQTIVGDVVVLSGIAKRGWGA